ncbi:MAG: septum formation initiator family protein [Bdellovibrionales bacterium]|nr:septum formation initiator family protein [Bdellovibrionales bacterium]
MRTFIRLLFSAAIISVVVVTYQGKNGFESLVRLNHTEVGLKHQEAALLKEIRRLEQDIHRATHDQEYLQNQARKELLVSSPDEIVYIFPEDRTAGR